MGRLEGHDRNRNTNTNTNTNVSVNVNVNVNVRQTDSVNGQELQGRHRLNTQTLMTRGRTGEEREEGGDQVR